MSCTIAETWRKGWENKKIQSKGWVRINRSRFLLFLFKHPISCSIPRRPFSRWRALFVSSENHPSIAFLRCPDRSSARCASTISISLWCRALSVFVETTSSHFGVYLSDESDDIKTHSRRRYQLSNQRQNKQNITARRLQRRKCIKMFM